MLCGILLLGLFTTQVVLPAMDGLVRLVTETTTALTKPTTRARTKVIQPGDQLGLIASQHGLTLTQLLAVGGNRARFPNPDHIRPGQVVDLPPAPSRR